MEEGHLGKKSAEKTVKTFSSPLWVLLIPLRKLPVRFSPEGLRKYPISYGILGYGRPLKDNEEDQWNVNLVNATGNYVTELPGICYFDSTQAFGMVRGRHLDFTLLGAYQVSERGDLANWATPDWVSSTGEIMIGSVGGAMDLAIGAKSVIVMALLCSISSFCCSFLA